jgi:hypothetical protein
VAGNLAAALLDVATKILQGYLIPVWLSIVYAAPIIFLAVGAVFLVVLLYILFFNRRLSRRRK